MAITPGPGPTKSKIQNPNSKRPVWISDFGFWISDFGFWISDFGFWILDFGFRILDFGFWVLDQFSLRSFCGGGPKRPRLDFGFWISDFGFWILDFGLGLGLLRTVWILHKIFPSHADSGRRIPFPFSFTKWVENQICTFSPSFVANDGCFFVKMDVFSRWSLQVLESAAYAWPLSFMTFWISTLGEDMTCLYTFFLWTCAKYDMTHRKRMPFFKMNVSLRKFSFFPCKSVVLRWVETGWNWKAEGSSNRPRIVSSDWNSRLRKWRWLKCGIFSVDSP